MAKPVIPRRTPAFHLADWLQSQATWSDMKVWTGSLSGKLGRVLSVSISEYA